MRKIVMSVGFIFFVTIIVAQKNVNNYKYILVPNQFSFTKSPDQYQLNSLTKFLFERAGFNALLESEITPEILGDRCNSLNAKLVDDSSMFTTKMKIELYDCFNKKVFETQVAKTKEKEFKKAYHAVIRKAFVDIENLNYKYVPLKGEKPKQEVTTIVNEKIKDAKSKISEEVRPKKPINTTVAIAPKKLEKKVIKKDIKKEQVKKIKKPKKTLTKAVLKQLEGNYIFEKWGRSTITKNGENYEAKGGDENFQFATIYKTSIPNIFIIKYVMSKQPRLVKMTAEGNLKIDTKSGVEVTKRL